MDSASGAPKGASNGGGAASSEEDSESESESSSSSSSRKLEKQTRTRTVSEELESFRNQWKEELKKEKGIHSPKQNSKSREEEPSSSSSSGDLKTLIKNRGGKVEGIPVEDQAKHWFLQGVGLERKGELYDAVKCYRRAVQLVPDIEYRVGSSNPVPNPNTTPSEASSSQGTPQDSDEENDTDVEEDGEDEQGPLMAKFLKIIEGRKWDFFIKAKDDGKVHLNDFPVEVITYILRWLVSSDLDVRSLDLLSNTCRGFYCLCRDEKIWQMACEKVWSDIGSETCYSSFREMFLKRPRVRFDGCYICKVTYIRPGEHSFQDQSYRPWHFVEYYRFIRFLPNEEILFLTTSDEPATSVSGLRDPSHPRNTATMRGTYRLYGNGKVSAVATKSNSILTPIHRGRGAKLQTQDVTTFHMEFEISPVKNRAHWTLKWLRYAVHVTRCPVLGGNRVNNNNNLNDNDNSRVSSTAFDLNPSKFPPLYFSRVKSYTQKSEGIL